MSSKNIYRADMPRFTHLDEDTSCDVLIIGGGLCGLLCAYYLTSKGANVLVCEADRIANATTARSTAVITSGQDVLCHDIAKRFGESAAMAVMRERCAALRNYRELAKKLDCTCDERDYYLFTTEKPSKLVSEYELLKRLGFESELLTKMPLDVPMNAALKFSGQLQLDPLDFSARIAIGLDIRENTRVTQLTPYGALAKSESGQYKINARRVIIATHFPLPKLKGLFALKLYQERSYVLALEGVPDIDATYEDIAKEGVYLRMYDHYLLLGGGDHRTGKSGGGMGALMRYKNERFPSAKIVTSWATQDTVSLDGLPYIGRLTPSDERVLVATGFGGNGFIGSMMSATILSDLALGRDNAAAKLFDPSRSMLTTQLFKNIGTTLVDFLTPTAKRCPHLGCALVWNAAERSWDCPCHGSRFSEDGNLLNDPSQGGID